MNIAARTVFIPLALTATVIAAPAHAFRADAFTSLLACSGGSVTNEGGLDFNFVTTSDAVSGECSPGVDASADASGTASIAAGTTVVTANAEGPTGSNRATAGSSFTDFLFIDAPAGVDTVEVFASIDLTADYTGAFDFSNDFLFGNVTVEATGQIEIRRCTPFICPNDPIQSDSISQTFTVQRSAFSGEFPQINVQLENRIDVVNGGGTFTGAIVVELLGNTGAVLTSFSGVWGTGGSPDSDGDGVADDADNCTAIANPDQRDTNGDGYGNLCDADLDNSGLVNAVDLGLFRAVFFTADADADFDGDGIVNVVDLGILKGRFFLPPGP